MRSAPKRAIFSSITNLLSNFFRPHLWSARLDQQLGDVVFLTRKWEIATCLTRLQLNRPFLMFRKQLADHHRMALKLRVFYEQIPSLAVAWTVNGWCLTITGHRCLARKHMMPEQITDIGCCLARLRVILGNFLWSCRVISEVGNYLKLKLMPDEGL